MRRQVVVWLVCVCLLGCNGQIGSAGTGAASTAGPTGPDGLPTTTHDGPSTWMPGASSGDPHAAPLMPLRRLTTTEYDNVVRDLLRDTSHLADSFSQPIAGSSGFATSGVVGDVDVVSYQKAAEKLAASADIHALSGCDPATSSENACADEFIKDFGQLAFRRPLTLAEATDYSSLYASDLRKGLGLTHEDALRAVLETMLQDGPFLYHWELGPRAPKVTDGVVALTPYEVASRLSFFLWSSMPDQTLFGAAANGSLLDPAALEAQARRLLADDRATDSVRSFHLQWLQISVKGAAKSPERYPTFTPELAQSMEDEVVEFARSVMADPRAGIADLFTGRGGFVNAALGQVYGTAGTGDQLAPVMLDAARRPGILTRAGFLAATSNAYEGDPTKRGVVIRKRVLCQALSAPPANVPPLPPPAPDATVRERHAAHMTQNPCRSCHLLTDLIGFGFSNYDAIGQFQTTEVGKSVDASGRVIGLDGKDLDFAGPAQLMQILSESSEVQACLTKQWLRFAYDRLETSADDYSLDQVFERFKSTGFNITELLVAMTRSRAFLYRAPAEGEVTQ